MLWILIAAAVCAGDLIVKHYIDTHKEENCHEPVSAGILSLRVFIIRGQCLDGMKDKPKIADGCDNYRYWCVGRRIDGITL